MPNSDPIPFPPDLSLFYDSTRLTDYDRTDLIIQKEWPLPIELAVKTVEIDALARAIANDDQKRDRQASLLIKGDHTVTQLDMIRMLMMTDNESYDNTERIAERLAYDQPKLSLGFIVALDRMSRLVQANSKVNGIRLDKVFKPTSGSTSFPAVLGAPAGADLTHCIDFTELKIWNSCHQDEITREPVSSREFGAYLVWSFLSTGKLPEEKDIDGFLNDKVTRDLTIKRMAGDYDEFAINYYFALGLRQAREIKGLEDETQPIDGRPFIV